MGQKIIKQIVRFSCIIYESYDIYCFVQIRRIFVYLYTFMIETFKHRI